MQIVQKINQSIGELQNVAKEVESSAGILHNTCMNKPQVLNRHQQP